jgi:putative oxidoreductase
MNTTARAWKQWLGEALAWAFGIIFIYSGCLKVGDPSQFLVSIRSFHFLPDPFAAWMALALPWLEIFAGLAVLTGWLRQGGLLLLNASLVIFAFALISAWVRKLDIECGCFGTSHGATNIGHALLRDAVLLIVGGWLWWMDCKRDARR